MSIDAMPADIKQIVIHRQNCNFDVYIQGYGLTNGLSSFCGKTVFLTVHDVGFNPQSFIDFVNTHGMGDVRKHAIFLHVCVPGQQQNAPDLLGDFPTMDQIGENLVHVLDAFDLHVCIGLGEGAGADILCRFAIAWPNRVLGLILIHCLATPHGLIESFKEIINNLSLAENGMNSANWEYLYAHRFGLHSKPIKEAFIAEVSGVVNQKNLARYLYQYSRRSDIDEEIRKKLDSTYILLVTGSRSPHNENVRHLHENMSREKTTMLMLDDVLDVLNQAPDRLARALILFSKGFGELSGVQIPGIGRSMSPSLSMEEADRPIGHNSQMYSQKSS